MVGWVREQVSVCCVGERAGRADCVCGESVDVGRWLNVQVGGWGCGRMSWGGVSELEQGDAVWCGVVKLINKNQC